MTNIKKLVFINPPLKPEEQYGDLSQAGSFDPPFGLCHLAAVTREKDYKTTIIDSSALQLTNEETAKLILDITPDYVGITTTTIAIFNAAEIARRVKEANNKIIIIIGGAHATANAIETMKRFGSFDYCVLGEGENTVLELFNKLENNESLASVKGIAYREGNEIRITEKRELIRNLDEYPLPAFDILPKLSKYYRIPTQSIRKLPAVSLMTERGCPGQCTFCDRSVFGRTCRFYSAEKMIELVKLYN